MHLSALYQKRINSFVFNDFGPRVLTSSSLTAPPLMPHSCSGEVTALPNTGGKQMVDNGPGETSLSWRQRQELPTKSPPIPRLRGGNNGPNGGSVGAHSLGSWLRTNRSAQTALHLVNKRGKPRHDQTEMEMENSSANDQN